MITFRENRLTMTRATFQAVLGFASRDSKREHLCGVRFESERMISTDGHSIVVADHFFNDGKEITPRTYSIASLLELDDRAKELRAREIVIDMATDTAYLNTSLDRVRDPVSLDRVRKPYPDQDQYIPKDQKPSDAVSAIGFDPALVGRLNLIGKAIIDSEPRGDRGKLGKPPTWKASFHGPEGPIMYEPMGGRRGPAARWLVLVMPVRIF